MLTGARNAGLSWQTAWHVARQAALKGLRYQDKVEWSVALNATAPEWEAAYLRRPSGRDFPLDALRDD